MSDYKLRYYQEESVKKTLDYMRKNEGNPLVVLPTGSGKTIVIASMCDIALRNDRTVLVLAHTKKLVQQNLEKLTLAFPEHQFSCGVMCSGLGAGYVGKVTFGTVQTCANRLNLLSPNLVIIDEAHIVSSDKKSQYFRLLEGLKEKNKSLRIMGLTATPYRLKGGSIVDDKKTFHEIVYNAGVDELIAEEFLSKINYMEFADLPNLEKVKKMAGDYNLKELSEAVCDTKILAKQVAGVVNGSLNNNFCLIFCVSIAHAEQVMALLPEGQAQVVHSKLPSQQQTQIINDFENKKYKYLCNVDMLTTGFDFPEIDCIALLRPTKSKGLYYQMVGRGLRLADGKEECLVLDFAGCLAEHGHIGELEEEESEEEKSEKSEGRTCLACGTINPYSYDNCSSCDEILYKTCQDCEGLVLPSSNICPDCGGKPAGGREIIDPEMKTTRVKVKEINYYSYISKAGNALLKVVYTPAEGSKITKFVPIGSTDNRMRGMASRWLSVRGITKERRFLVTIKNICNGSFSLKKPEYINVRENKHGYPEIYKEFFLAVKTEEKAS